MFTGKKISRFLISAMMLATASTNLLAFDNTNILVEEAVNHIYQLRYKQAHTVLKQAYEKSPRHPGVHFNLGRLFELTKNYNEALKEYRLAAMLDTSMVSARRGMARCSVELKRLKLQAAKTAKKQVVSQPQRPQAPIITMQPEKKSYRAKIVHQAPVKTQQPRYPSSMKNAQELSLPPLPPRVMQQATRKTGEDKVSEMLDKGQTDKALKELQKILKSNPDSPKAHYLMGKVLSIKSDLFASIKHLEEAIRVDNKFYDAYYLLGKNYSKVNLLEDAIKNFQIYYAVKPQANVALEIARIYESMGQPQQAKQFYARANAMNPGNPSLQTRLVETTGSLANDLYLRANHAFTTKKYKESINLFQQALQTRGLLPTYQRDASRKIEVARFKAREIENKQRAAKEGFKTSRKVYGTINLKYPQLADINFKTRFTGAVTVEWTGYIAKRFKRYGKNFLLMIKELSQDELDEMRRDRNDYRLNKHYNNQPVFLLAATKSGFPPFAKPGKLITFTGSTDWKFYNILNEMGQTIQLPSFDYISSYPK
jgi:tetratricopeptide (TPR) repeat protein